MPIEALHQRVLAAIFRAGCLSDADRICRLTYTTCGPSRWFSCLLQVSEAEDSAEEGKGKAKGTNADDLVMISHRFGRVERNSKEFR